MISRRLWWHMTATWPALFLSSIPWSCVPSAACCWSPHPGSVPTSWPAHSLSSCLSSPLFLPFHSTLLLWHAPTPQTFLLRQTHLLGHHVNWGHSLGHYPSHLCPDLSCPHHLHSPQHPLSWGKAQSLLYLWCSPDSCHSLLWDPLSGVFPALLLLFCRHWNGGLCDIYSGHPHAEPLYLQIEE